MKLEFVKRPSAKLLLAVTIIILVAGVAVGLAGMTSSNFGSNVHAPGLQANFGAPNGSGADLSNGANGSYNTPVGSAPVTTVVQEAGTTVSQVTEVASSSSTESLPSTLPISSSGSTSGQQSQQNAPPAQNLNRSGFIEFFSNVTIQVSSAQTALSKATALAYSYGGYLAYSSYSNVSSIAVLRIPAANYASALSGIEGLGNLTGLQSNSNDVSIQYTDLNATLQSFLTEQTSLLKLENSSNSLNSTLLLEGQIQNVDTQINEIQSQILQARLLIDYSTITANFNVNIPTPPPKPLSMKLTATPTSGLNPLSVTFNAVVTGGVMPYIVNYNFADGSSYQGQTLIHTFTESGTFNVTVTLTDASGSVLENYTIIRVANPPVQSGFTSLPATLWDCSSAS